MTFSDPGFDPYDTRYNSGEVASEIVDALTTKDGEYGSFLAVSDAGGHVRDISYFEVTDDDDQVWTVAVSPKAPVTPVKRAWGWSLGNATYEYLRNLLIVKGYTRESVAGKSREQLERMIHNVGYHAERPVATCPACA